MLPLSDTSGAAHANALYALPLLAVLFLSGAALTGCADASEQDASEQDASEQDASEQDASADTSSATMQAPDKQDLAAQNPPTQSEQQEDAPGHAAPPRTAASNPAQAANTPGRPDSAEVPSAVEVPDSMAYVPGGTTRIGITEETWKKVQQMGQPGARMLWGRAARPSFVTQVAPFLLEKHPVTVAQFRQFVEATGFETQAEAFGNAGVMAQGRWQLVDGATWRRPRGPSAPEAPDDHPVTQVSYNDAEAYCAWKDRRLPTEVEWEHAARGATNDRALCPDGQCPSPSSGAAPVANTWQGRFPATNTVADGFRYTAPVGAFGETRLGLTGMSGNVWEWTSSWYRPYDQRGMPFRATKQSEKVQRGGSFQCNECGGYRVFARSHATRETSLFHVSVRCAKDAP